MLSDWRPTASLEALRMRAGILGAIRGFFAERGVLEVETPLLAAAPVTDVHLQALSTRYRGPGHDEGLELWLQTSPEFAMKRLLAASNGPIYSLGKAFRDGEAGSRHNPEFTLLEWYRPGWDHHRLMDEVEALIVAVLGSSGRVSGSGSGSGQRLTYAEAFRRHAGVDPFHDPVAALANRAAELLGHAPPDLGDDRDAWLELLLSHAVEPQLGRGRPTFVFDFPASQAALARIRPGDPPVAERFELFLEGVELANGYHELGDPAEQRRRFEADLAERRVRGLLEVPVDERLLAALAHGLPDCAGVALGVDRLVMLAAGASRIDQVIAFPVDRA
ncbi:MAG TPA: EF-P lysine aminoacylase EpmA [Candidatus Sulfomarinibacteraceae bacterium]|nr:EF-P lysine aminoacylase EpmA [Candidatus Sulfomarinibacteraceae bacterium]